MIEMSRYDVEPVEERITTVWSDKSKDNKINFLLHCLLYNDCRRRLYENI